MWLNFFLDLLMCLKPRQMVIWGNFETVTLPCLCVFFNGIVDRVLTAFAQVCAETGTCCSLRDHGGTSEL